MKLKITITGKVHDVGYRPFLFRLACRYSITHFDARNVVIEDKQAVEVLVDGEEQDVKEFVERIKSDKPLHAAVEDVKIEEFDGRIGTIKSFIDVFIIEQLDRIIQIGRSYLQKQDKTIGAIHETRTYLGEKIDLLRDDLKSTRFDSCD